jgi:hypothetical protein
VRAVVQGLALVWLAAPTAAAQRPEPALEIRETGRITDPRVTESSGAIRGVVNPDVVWTINDSGNPPTLFAIDTTGRVRAAIDLTNATNVDWEAISIGPCPRSAAPCLYLGDVGDNFSRRGSVTLYRLPEPRLASSPPARLAVRDSLVVRYTSGPEDVESLVVTAGGDALLFGKGWRSRPHAFLVPDSAWTGGRYRAAPVDSLPIETGLLRGALVTDAALSPDQRWLAIRTYREIYLFHHSGPGLSDLRHPVGICDVSGREPQGEGLAFWDPHTLVLTSERLLAADGTVLLVRCPGL